MSNSVERVELPKSLIYIGGFAFSNFNILKSIEIPNSVDSIGLFAFFGCDQLKNINIPNSVKSIGECAFWGCEQVESITLPNSLKKIGISAFERCTKIQVIKIPNSVMSLGKQSFEECTSLKKIELSNKIKQIDTSTFSRCKNLEEIQIPYSVVKINAWAFEECTNLRSIVIPNPNVSIDKEAFKNCHNVNIIDASTLAINEVNEIKEANSETDNNNGLLYKGIYTISGQARSQTTGGYTGIAAQDLVTEIEIYNDSIIVGFEKCKYSRSTNTERVYESSDFGWYGNTSYNSYYVDENFNIRKVNTFSTQFGTEWFEYQVSKGRCTMPNNYQGQTTTSYETQRTPVRQRCRVCQRNPGVCYVCNGKREIPASVNYSTGEAIMGKCRSCNNTGICSACGGDGWIEEGVEF